MNHTQMWNLKIIKFLEENEKENICFLGLGKNFLAIHLKLIEHCTSTIIK